MRTRSAGQTIIRRLGTNLLLEAFEANIVAAVNKSFGWIIGGEYFFALRAVDLEIHQIITVNF